MKRKLFQQVSSKRVGRIHQEYHQQQHLIAMYERILPTFIRNIQQPISRIYSFILKYNKLHYVGIGVHGYDVNDTFLNRFLLPRKGYCILQLRTNQQLPDLFIVDIDLLIVTCPSVNESNLNLEKIKTSRIFTPTVTVHKIRHNL